MLVCQLNWFASSTVISAVQLSLGKTQQHASHRVPTQMKAGCICSGFSSVFVKLMFEKKNTEWTSISVFLISLFPSAIRCELFAHHQEVSVFLSEPLSS